MSESRRPTLAEIAAILGQLSDHAAVDAGPRLDPVLAAAVVRASFELRSHIPGLTPSPDPRAARELATDARAALASGDGRGALASALGGLAHAPHDPELHYLAGSACFELGAVKCALAEIGLALWVNPGYEVARHDLEALSAFCQAQQGRARRATRKPKLGPAPRKKRNTPRNASPLPFEFPDLDEPRDDAAEEDRAA